MSDPRLSIAPLLILLWAACAPPPAQAPEPRPEVVLYGVRLSSFRNNQLVAVGGATRLAYERASSNADVEMPMLRLPSRSRVGGEFAELGGVEIRAQRAEGNLGNQKIEAFGGVNMRSGSGVVARTDRALFDGAAMVTSGAGPVEVRGPAYALNANGFVLSSKDEDFQFGGPLQSGLGRVR